jgi:hypothetical protein
MFGVQTGFDFWWNMHPGISLGLGAKGAWLQNDVDRAATITANSLGLGATPGSSSIFDGAQKSTIAGDFELKTVYRLSHSWSFRGSYYVLAVDDVVFGGLDAETGRTLVQTGSADRPFAFDDLVLQGFTVGAEYMW